MPRNPATLRPRRGSVPAETIRLSPPNGAQIPTPSTLAEVSRGTENRPQHRPPESPRRSHRRHTEQTTVPPPVSESSHGSKAYSGALALAACSYFIFAVLILVLDPKGIVGPLAYFGIQMTIYQPMLQIFWLLCDFWMEKMPLFSEWAAAQARQIIFTSIISLSIAGLAPSPLAGILIDPTETTFDFILTENYVLVAMTVAYAISLLWLVQDFKAVRRPALVRLRFRLGISLFFVGVAAVAIWSIAFIFLEVNYALVLAAALVLPLSYLSFHHRLVTGEANSYPKRSRFIQFCVFFVVLISQILLGFFLSSLILFVIIFNSISLLIMLRSLWRLVTASKSSRAPPLPVLESQA